MNVRGHEHGDRGEPGRRESAQEIAADIRATRHELARTIEALADRTDPRRQAHRMLINSRIRVHDALSRARLRLRANLARARRRPAGPAGPAGRGGG
jgi:hypothetical protein